MAKGKLFIGIRKNIFSLILNIIGLTVAFTAFMVIMVQVRYDMGFDNFYKNKDRVFRVEFSMGQYTGGEYSAYMSRPLSRQLAEASPDIELWGNWGWSNPYDVKATESDGEYVSADNREISYEILSIFEFEIIEGAAESFANPEKALVPSELAATLFPEGNAVGKSITMEGMGPVEVVAVYKEFPDNSSMGNMIYSNIWDTGMEDSTEWSFPMYIRINDAGNRDKVEAAMNAVMLETFKESYGLEEGRQVIRLSKPHDIYYSKDVRYDEVEKGNRSTTVSLLTIAIFILLIAIINFINFALAAVPSKIKAINIQKIIGSGNGALRRTQIAESVILACVSFLLALIIFNVLKGTSVANYLSAPMAISANGPVVALAAVAAVVTGIVAGIYPAFYSTSYQPALVLKGSFSLSPGGRRLRAFLIGFQFTVSLILIVVALYIKVQSDYMKKYDMGFRTENVVNYRIGNSVAIQKASYVSKLKESPYITDVTFADGPLVSNGKMGWGRRYRNEQIQFDCFPVDPNFIEFFGLEVIEGRGFEQGDELKVNGTMIFNETAVKKYNLEIGDKLYGHNGDADIVGMVKDFNFQPLQYGINPICLYVFGSEPWRNQTYTYVKIAPGGIPQALEHIKSVNVDFDPYLSDINYTFMDEGVNRLYAKEDALASLILIFCYLSVFISVMGILGLIFFETRFRRKEIALRRVMGSTIPELLVRLNSIYIKITLFSFVVAAPLAWYICRTWVKGFQYQAPVPVWIFLAALLSVLIITIIIITARSYKAVTANPVDSITGD